jgi:hypothetical protein
MYEQMFFIYKAVPVHYQCLYTIKRFGIPHTRGLYTYSPPPPPGGQRETKKEETWKKRDYFLSLTCGSIISGGSIRNKQGPTTSQGVAGDQGAGGEVLHDPGH